MGPEPTELPSLNLPLLIHFPRGGGKLPHSHPATLSPPQILASFARIPLLTLPNDLLS